MFDEIIESMTHLPLLARFAIALLLFLTIPPLCKRIRLPAAVGLLLAGVVLGPSALHIAPEHGEVAQFFADVGKLLLMFFAGLEIDLDQFLRIRNRSLTFGVATSGYAYGKCVERPPCLVGISMVILGSVLVGLTIALGG